MKQLRLFTPHLLPLCDPAPRLINLSLLQRQKTVGASETTTTTTVVVAGSRSPSTAPLSRPCWLQKYRTRTIPLSLLVPRLAPTCLLDLLRYTKSSIVIIFRSPISSYSPVRLYNLSGVNLSYNCRRLLCAAARDLLTALPRSSRKPELAALSVIICCAALHIPQASLSLHLHLQ